MNYKQKVSLAIGIAYGIDYLHSKSILHLHLSARNILIDDEGNPRIADYGFHRLKEIASIFIKYRNKNSYTSPEVLVENSPIGNSINLSKYKADIYSYGMILWEIFTEMVPFDVKLKTLYNYIVIEDMRPEIPDTVPKNISELICQCWNKSEDERPSMKQVISILEKE